MRGNHRHRTVRRGIACAAVLLLGALASACGSSSTVTDSGITTTYPALPITEETTTTAPATGPTTTSSIPFVNPTGPPQVVSFTAGPVDCTKSVDGIAQVQVAWSTRNTIAVYINGGDNAYALGDPKTTSNFGIEPAEGTAKVPFICTDLIEFYRLGAYGSNNRSASSSVEVKHPQ